MPQPRSLGFLRWTIVVLFLSFHAIAGEIDSFYTELKKATTPSKKAEIYAQIAFTLSNSNPDSAFTLVHKGLDLVSEKHAPGSYAICLNTLGWVYYRLSRNDTAEYYLHRAVALFHSVGNSHDEARSLLNLCVIYEGKREFEKCLRYLLRARVLTELAHDEKSMAYVDKMIGIIYRKQGDVVRAKKYFFSALAVFERIGAHNYSSDAYSSLGELYRERKQFDSAFWCYRQAIGKVKTDDQWRGMTNNVSLGYSYENIGTTFLDGENMLGAYAVDSALNYFAIAYRLFKEAKSWQDAAYEELNIGKCLLKKKQHASSEQFLKKALVFFDSILAYNYAYEATQLLSELYKEKQDFRQALVYAEKSKSLNDTLNVRNRNEIVTEMLTRYESDKKDRTIALLDARQKLAEKDLSRNRTVNVFSLILVLLILTLAFTLFNRYRIKQQLKEFQLRNQFANDLHDDIGSSLSSILLLTKMASGGSASRINSEEVIDRISQNTREVIDKVSDIVWTTNPRFDEGDKLRDKIEKYITQIRKIADVEIRLGFADVIDGYRFPMEVRKNIFLICKEALNNAFKYSGASTIDLNFGIAGKSLLMEVKDNGKGFEATENERGNGFNTMKSRAEAINAVLSINSIPGVGTTVALDLPISQYKYANL